MKFQKTNIYWRLAKFKLFFIIIIKSGEIFILDGNIFFPPNDGDVKLLHQVNHLNSHKSSYSKDLILSIKNCKLT